MLVTGLDDLLQAAEQLSSGNENDRVYGFSSNSSQDIFYMLSANGVALTRGSGANEQPAFTDPAVVEALQRYLSTLKNISPASNITGYAQNNSGDNTNLLRHQGRIGMWLQYGGNTASLDSNQEGNVTLGIAPPPFAKHANPAIALFSSGMFISATTQHAQACWQWMNYLAGESSAVEYGFPARLSIAQSTAFTNTAPQGSAAVIKAYRTLLTGAATTPPWFQSEIDFYWLFRAIDHSLQGNGALDSELADAQRLTEEYLSCSRATDKKQACAKQVDPNYAGWASDP